MYSYELHAIRYQQCLLFSYDITLLTTCMIIFLQADPGLVRVVKIDHGLLFPAVEYLQECIIAENEAGTCRLGYPPN